MELQEQAEANAMTGVALGVGFLAFLGLLAVAAAAASHSRSGNPGNSPAFSKITKGANQNPDSQMRAKLVKQLERGESLTCSFNGNTVKAWKEEPFFRPGERVKEKIDGFRIVTAPTIYEPYKLVVIGSRGFTTVSQAFKDSNSLIDNYVRLCRL